MWNLFLGVVTLFIFSHNPVRSRDAVLTKRKPLCQGFSSLVTGDGGAGRTLACFLPYGFHAEYEYVLVPHNGQWRVRKSSYRSKTGQLLVIMFYFFLGEMF